MKQDSWLYSDSFLKRALAIYGYNLVAGMIIGLPVAFVLIVLGVMLGAMATPPIQ